MEKPSTGWLHDDSNIINGDGVFYAVKYIGSIPMGMSMSQVTPHSSLSSVKAESSFCFIRVRTDKRPLGLARWCIE